MDPDGYGVYRFKLTAPYRQRTGMWVLEYTFPTWGRCEETRRTVESALRVAGDLQAVVGPCQ
jgi:hypothetical protein